MQIYTNKFNEKDMAVRSAEKDGSKFAIWLNIFVPIF